MDALFSDLPGRSALVTGAAGVIGEAIATALRRQGAHVMLCDRPESELAEAGRRVRAQAAPEGADGTVAECEIDVAEEVSAREAVAAAADAFSGLDLVVNCAAVRGASATAVDLSREEWDRVIGVGLTGAWLVSRQAAPHLARSGAGAIVNIGSTAGRLPRVGQAAYCVAKAGLEQITRVMALELAVDGVRVNAVCPGATETPLLAYAAANEGLTTAELSEAIVSGDPATFRAGIPLRRLATPEDHAAAVVFLASQSARHITGQAIYVDGGETMV